MPDDRGVVGLSASAWGPLAARPNGAAAPPRSLGAGARARAGKARRPFGLSAVYVLWFIQLFDPQWLIAAHGPKVVLRLPLFLFGAVAVAVISRARPRMWFLPLLCIMLYAVVTVPFVENIGLALKPTKELVLYYILAIGTLAYVRKPKQAIPIVLMALVYQYTWWAGFGALHGVVMWDSSYDNYDAFGPLMVMGVTSAAYAGFAARSKWLRRLAFVTALACVVGLVASYARGAVLAGGAVLVLAWIRSPRKGAATVGIVAVFAVVLLSGVFLFSNSFRGTDTNPNFFDEMLSIGPSVTKGAGEGVDRVYLWKVAWQEFLARPVFGVGQDCYGVYAATHFKSGQIAGPYRSNPGRMYYRAVHNAYFETLSERGSIGMLLYIWLFVDFWRRNRRMKAARYVARWKRETGGKLDLRALAIAMETAMVGFLGSAWFYNELDFNFLYVLTILNLLLYTLSVGAPFGRRRPRRSVAQVPTGPSSEPSHPFIPRSRPAPGGFFGT